jgi:putative cardiolipin synthase
MTALLQAATPEHFGRAAVAFERCLLASFFVALAGCATLPPPGSDYPKKSSTAFAQPTTTTLGKQFAAQATRHGGQSGFRVLPRGVDGLVLRTQLVRAAERAIDIQYYIFAEDDTGKLLLDAILKAADRGVRVRILLDDSNSFGEPSSAEPAPPPLQHSKEITKALNDHKNIELRLFNPFDYRGNVAALRYLDLALNAPRLNHRMHNKLMVVDNTVAIVGGRNVSDEYFDAGAPAVRFGDFDIAAVGPIVPQLSSTFDAYWNSTLSIPQQALKRWMVDDPSLSEARATLADARADGDIAALERRVAKADELRSLMTGRVQWTWANAQVIVDPPEKAEVPPGESPHSPIAHALLQAMKNAREEVDIVTPYFVPGAHGLSILEELRQRNVRVRLLTNSLASTDVPIVHGAYSKYRKPLVESGAEVSEIKPIPGQDPERSGSLGSGSGLHGSGSGSEAPFALHAKIYIVDNRRVFVGSANFDRRSFHINTELGLMIESPELAKQIGTRFDQFAGLANSYQLVLHRDGPLGPRLRWRTEIDGRVVELDDDPDATPERRLQAALSATVPIDELL